MVRGVTLAEAWEKSLVTLWQEGCDFRTEYDAKDPVSGQWLDPPSKDATMMVVVEQPMADPMIHRSMPGGLEDLEEYRQEVVDGIKDHWVRDPNDPTDNRWEYTYHERLTAYRVGDKKIDQLAYLVDKLSAVPYSRRCNAITWQPWIDNSVADPPCLQSIWCRLLENDARELVLNMNVRFRSRDAYDAAFMNMFAFIFLMKDLADRIAQKAARNVVLGRYCDLSDSYHIYGKRFYGGPTPHFVDGFLKLLERPFEDRVWTLAFAEEIFQEAREKIRAKVIFQDGKK
jgi:thymidylate synthase